MPASSDDGTLDGPSCVIRVIRLTLPALIILSAILAPFPTPCRAMLRFIDVESGWAFAGYNDVRVPGDSGTKFSLTDDLRTDSAPFIRFRIGRVVGEKHYVSGFVAPLRLSADGTLNKTVRFQDVVFEAGSDIEADYRFDSYRLTYRYRVWLSPPYQAWLGFTAKVRNAEVAVRSTERFSSLENTGFVPLFSFHFEWEPRQRWTAILEGDALAGGPGRAEDVFLGLAYDANDRWTIKGGYRILEGGADVDEAYNFALIHFASLGLVLNL